MTTEEYFNIKVHNLPDEPAPPPKRTGLLVAIALCVLFAAIVLVIWLRARCRTGQAAETRPMIRLNPIIAQRSVDALKEHDPSFDPQAFTERTRAVVAAVNKAWLAGEMGPARRLISDGVFVRFTTQLHLLRSQGLRNAMADWRVVSAEILAADCDDLWDTVHVKIVGAARDQDLPLELPPGEADKRLQRVKLAEYDEAWSFVRRRGKNSLKGAPALEGRCPSCGAPTDKVNMAGTCEYCGAHLTRGEFDWVLSKIEQDESYRG